MVENLTDFLKNATPQGFERLPYFSPEGDFLTIYFRDDEAFAQRVDELLTVYKAVDSHELVGCKIKGVSRLIERLGKFGISLKEEGSPVKFNLLFLSAACDRAADVREYYEAMGRFTRDLSLDPGALQLT